MVTGRDASGAGGGYRGQRPARLASPAGLKGAQGAMKRHKRVKRKRGGAAEQRGRNPGGSQRQPRGGADGFTEERVQEAALALVEYYQEQWAALARGLAPGDMAAEEEWVDYWEKEARWYEELIEGLAHGRASLPATGEGAHLLRKRGGQWSEAFAARVRPSTCALLQEQVYWLRVTQAAERFRPVVRRALYQACLKQSGGPAGEGEALAFFTIPPDTQPPPPEDDPAADKRALGAAEAYRMAIWWMTADHRDQFAACRTHFYLECFDGYYSAEVYPEVGEEAAIEAARRRLRGEGDFEVRVIFDDPDPNWPVFMVLYCRHRPVDPATQPPPAGPRFAELSPVPDDPHVQVEVTSPPSYVLVGWVRPRQVGQEGEAICRTCREQPARYTYESFGYEGVEDDAQALDEALEEGERGEGGGTLGEPLNTMFQKTRAAQRQGDYRVVGAAPCCEGCLAGLADGFLAMEQAGGFTTAELRAAEGRLSCVLAWRIFSEEEDNRLPALLYTEAHTVEDLLPRLPGTER
jgi:hypothetical protein